jgi:hypothetical protein
MKRRINTSKQFAICIDNSEYPASLELHKIYAILPDQRAAQDGFLRIVDESGEDYLYSVKRFVPIELPHKVKLSINRTSRPSELTAAKSSPHAAAGRRYQASD